MLKNYSEIEVLFSYHYLKFVFAVSYLVSNCVIIILNVPQGVQNGCSRIAPVWEVIDVCKCLMLLWDTGGQYSYPFHVL